MSFDAISSMGSSSQLSAITDFLTGSTLTEMIPTTYISNLVEQMSRTYHLVLLAIILLIALFGCFLGYKFARALMSITGFVAGIFIGYYIFARIIDISGIALYLAILASAIFLAAMSFWIYRAVVFALCFVCAFAAAATILPFTNDVQFFLCTLVGFIVGAISQKFLRAVIIVTSSVVCGMIAGGTALQFAGLLQPSIPTNEFYQILVGIVFVVLGVIVQSLTTSSPEKKGKHSKNSKVASETKEEA